MANLNQFYKGEAIKITVADDEGNALVGEYSSTGVKGTYDGSTYKYAGLRVYPDDLNLENGESTKIKPFKPATSGDGAGKVFSIACIVCNFTIRIDERWRYLCRANLNTLATGFKTDNIHTLRGETFCIAEHAEFQFPSRRVNLGNELIRSNLNLTILAIKHKV